MGFGKDGLGVLFRQQDTISLTTLAPATVRAQSNPPAVIDSLRIIKSEGYAHIEGATFVDGDGPLALYLASGDLSTTEVAEAIETTAGQPLRRDDLIGDEQALRPVYYLGMIENSVADNGARKMMEWSWNIRWTFGEANAFTIVAVNVGSGALTTGGTIRFHHTAFGVWVGA